VERFKPGGIMVVYIAITVDEPSASAFAVDAQPGEKNC
jgi:hypothetical protein